MGRVRNIKKKRLENINFLNNQNYITSDLNQVKLKNIRRKNIAKKMFFISIALFITIIITDNSLAIYAFLIFFYGLMFLLIILSFRYLFYYMLKLKSKIRNRDKHDNKGFYVDYKNYRRVLIKKPS